MSALENGAGRTARVRRVVTGVDERGRSYVVSDGEAPNVFRSPTVSGFGAAQVWATRRARCPTRARPTRPPADAEIPMYPELGGTIFRVADFPPDSAYDKTGKDGLFADIGGDEARERRHPQRATVTSGSTRPTRSTSPSSSRARSGCSSTRASACSRPGDVIVQRGTAHSWSNRSGKPCRMAFLLLGALPVPAAEAADEEQLAGRQT